MTEEKVKEGQRLLDKLDRLRREKRQLGKDKFLYLSLD